VQLLFRGFIFRIIFTGVNFFISLLIAKLAGPAQFGSLSLMVVNAAVLVILTGLGSDAAIVWHGTGEKTGNQNKIYSVTVYAALIQVFLFVVISSLFFAFSHKSLLTGSQKFELFSAEFLYFTGLVGIDKFTALFYSRQESTLANRILAYSSLFVLFLLVICTVTIPGLIKNYPVWIFSLCVFFPPFCLILFYFFKFHPAFSSFGKKEFKSFIDFSFIVFITNLLQFIAYRADFWFIDYFQSKADVGIYAQAAKFAQLLWIIPGILAGLIIPALRNEIQKIQKPEFLSICRLVIFFHMVIATLLILFSFLLYRYFLPVEFFNGFESFLLMIPGYILFTITIMMASWFSANRLLKINLTGTLICLLAVIVTDRALIPTLSYRGAAIANLVSYSGTTLFFILASMSYLNAGWKDFFIIRKTDLMLFTKKFISPAVNKKA